MDAEDFHITSWVTVRNGVALHNGAAFFSNEEADAVSFIRELYKKLDCNYPKFYKMDNLCKLAFAAAELLLKDHRPDDRHQETALVFSNSSSSLDTDKIYFNSVEDKSRYFPSPSVFVYTLPNIMMGEICIRHGFLGENTFFISEMFDSDLLAEYTRNILTSGKAECVITGWIEISESNWDAALFLVESSGKGKQGDQQLSSDNLRRIYSHSG